MPNECYVYFGLRGEFDPDEISVRLGLHPTSSCAQGARSSDSRIPRTSLWDYSTERIVDNHIDVYDLAEQLITKLEPYADKIKAAIVDLNLSAVLQIVLHFSTDDEVSTPAIGFSQRVLAFLVEVDASIDIDTYILPHEDSPETH
jgi:hypothetical protein